MKAGDNKTGFDSTLCRGLSANAGATAQGCPDADLLAAYYERSLAPAEIERFDAHLSTCAHCREKIAALVRSEPPNEKTLDARAPWLWNWRWLAPAVAAIAIIVIWVGVREHNNLTSKPIEVAMTQTRPQEPAVPSPPVAQRAAPARTVTGDGLSKPAATPTFEKKFSGAPVRGLAKENAEAPVMPKRRASTGEPPNLTRERGGMSSAGGIVGSAVTAPPPPEDSALTQTLAQSAPADAAAPANRKATKLAAPQSQSVGAMIARNQLGSSAKIPGSNAPTRAKSAVADQLEVREESSNSILIPSPDATKSWRIAASGAIEFSSDSGVTWEMQRPGLAGALTAGYSPSAKICWIVGRGGAVLRTVNGIDWIKVTAPTTDDLTAVSASNAKHAQVTAAGGAVFVTKDGGKSWTPRNNP
ncbi:MAG TPA: zf-HC2 domain-containing protein [Candidatus Acidoferrales bacterium]